MELILSSPIPIVATFFLLIVIAVFIFELKSLRGKKKEKPPPLPPTSIPVPKKDESKRKKKVVLIAGGGILLLLLISLPVMLFLIRQQQAVLKRAEEVPAPTTTPEAVQPPPTATPTQPTAPLAPAKNQPPVCLKLSAQPTSGRTPLMVSFEAQARDDDGKITAFEFTFGDGETQLVEKDFEEGEVALQTIEHVYTEKGIFSASVRARDDSATLSEPTVACTVTVEVLTAAGTPPAVAGAAGAGEGVGGLTPNEASPTATLAVSPTATPSGSPATSTPQSEVAPEVPEAGFALPTAIVSLGGIFMILASLALVL